MFDEEYGLSPHKLLKKAKQSQQLRRSLTQMFFSWDESCGGESDLNCLDITSIAQASINDYLKTREEDTE